MTATTAPAARRPISSSLRELLATAFSAEELRHLAAAFDARHHVPEPLALAMADAMASIYSTPPIETEQGTIHNAPTIGFLRRWRRRIEDARRV